MTTPLLARHPLRTGVIFWSVFSIVAVAVRGVRWDENYEFAQVILGQIPFPTDHPLNQYVRSIYSIQPFGLAGLMYFLPGPLWANALRNVLFLMASTLPVYLWGTQVSRRPLVGHCAVVFVLMGIHIPFYSSYPIHVWPDIFSNGPIGLGYMLWALWALASDRGRLAGLLVGFAPLVHLGQFPPLLATVVLYGLWNLYRCHNQTLIHFTLALVPGILACLGFAVFLRYFSATPPTTGPYFTDTDAMTLWHHYMGHYATHRAIPYSTGHLLFFATLLLAPLAGFARYIQLQRTPTGPSTLPVESALCWAGVYLAITMATVWIIMGIHRVMGAEVPFLLAGWLPYRLMNHIAPLLIPLLIALAYGRDNRPPQWLPLLLIAALLAPLLHLVLPLEFVDRYFTNGDYLFFILFGAALGMLIVSIGREALSWGFGAGIGVAVAMVALAWYHQFGAACATLGFLAGVVPTLPRLSSRLLHHATACTIGLLLFAMLAKDFERREHLYTEPDLLRIAHLLAEHNEADAMILVSDRQVGMQMKLGHPVMADMVTLLIAAYRPPIAPSVTALFQDFYGIYLDPNAPAPDRDLAWHEVWPRKSLEDWQRLGEKYDVHFVIAPRFMDLKLEMLLPGRDVNLFRIPPSPTVPVPGQAAQGLEKSTGDVTPQDHAAPGVQN